MKVIFLDIDGVLNSENFFIARRGLMGTNQEFKGNFGRRQIDSNAIGILNYLIKETDAEIVLSSSWRSTVQEQNDEVNEILIDKGLIKKFIDVTPWTREGQRGTEIKMWLDKHPEVESYVIFDDDRDMLEEQKEFFIQTDEWNGLTAKDVYKAKEILNKEKENKYNI